MADIKPKLRVDVNHNPTKKGIKVQFVLPQTLEGDAKAQATQKLQSKLNQGLEQYNLTVSQDTDVPYSNVIGFLIPIADIKLLIKNAIGGGAAPEETPAPEEPMKEMKRMMELAGVKSSNIELIGPDIDELLDAINFINKGIGKGNQKVQLPFGNNTLKALDDDGQSIGGGKFSIGVQPKTSSESLYIRQVNDFLEDHGFECRLYITK